MVCSTLAKTLAVFAQGLSFFYSSIVHFFILFIVTATASLKKDVFPFSIA